MWEERRVSSPEQGRRVPTGHAALAGDEAPSPLHTCRCHRFGGSYLYFSLFQCSPIALKQTDQSRRNGDNGTYGAGSELRHQCSQCSRWIPKWACLWGAASAEAAQRGAESAETGRSGAQRRRGSSEAGSPGGRRDGGRCARAAPARGRAAAGADAVLGRESSRWGGRLGSSFFPITITAFWWWCHAPPPKCC